MFDRKTAWFSSSVSRNKKKLWFDNGGSEADLDDAQYVFSQDPNSADTVRVFESEAYLDEHLAVFHPNYICQCVKVGDIGLVKLGQYFFPPKDVQDIARQQIQYQWDVDGNTSDGRDVESDEDIFVSMDGRGKRPATNTVRPPSSPIRPTQSSQFQRSSNNVRRSPQPGPSRLATNQPSRFGQTQPAPNRGLSYNQPGPSRIQGYQSMTNRSQGQNFQPSRIQLGVRGQGDPVTAQSQRPPYSGNKMYKKLTPEKTPVKQAEAANTSLQRSGNKNLSSASPNSKTPTHKGLKRKYDGSLPQNVSNNSTVTRSQTKPVDAPLTRQQPTPNKTVTDTRQPALPAATQKVPSPPKTQFNVVRNITSEFVTCKPQLQKPAVHIDLTTPEQKATQPQSQIRTQSGGKTSPSKAQSAGKRGELVGDRTPQAKRVEQQGRGSSDKKQMDLDEEQEYLRLENLAKISGELEDFILGKNGCALVKLS